mgnify:CR=1 FL=1
MGITNPFSRVRVPTALSRTDIERTRILREQKKPTSKPIAPTDAFTTAKRIKMLYVVCYKQTQQIKKE